MARLYIPRAVPAPAVTPLQDLRPATIHLPAAMLALGGADRLRVRVPSAADLEALVPVVLAEARYPERLRLRMLAQLTGQRAGALADLPEEVLAQAFQAACDLVNAAVDARHAATVAALPTKARRQGDKARNDGGKRMAALYRRACDERARELGVRR